jgi:hypothetical protein
VRTSARAGNGNARPQLMATADSWSSLCLGHALSVFGVRRARRSGLASDGLALAVRPAGGASPDNARQGGPTGCDILPATGAYGARETALVVMLAGAAGGYGGDRRRPVTGVPCAAAVAP